MARPSTATPRGSTARRRIDDEHRQLGELLRSLTHTREVGRLSAELGALRELLVAHFAGEEGEEGLHAVVAEGASHRLPNLQRLFDEHRDLLAQVDALAGDAAALAGGPLARLHEGVLALAESLRRHEAVEEELFSEAFYRDIGGRS